MLVFLVKETTQAFSQIKLRTRMTPLGQTPYHRLFSEMTTIQSPHVSVCIYIYAYQEVIPDPARDRYNRIDTDTRKEVCLVPRPLPSTLFFGTFIYA